MNTLRWLFPPRNIQKEETRDTKKVDEMNGMEDTTELTEGSQSKPSYEAMTSAELIERVREEHEKLKKTQGQNQSQKLQLDTQNTALEKAYGEIEQYKATIANHEKTLTTQDQTISRNSARDANQKQQIQQLQTALKRSKKERQNLEQKFTNLNANHTQNQADHNRIVRSLHQTLDLTSKNLHDAQEANHDLKFDLELLRCTQNYSTQAETGPNSVGSFPAPPFVLVLVDGDAYEWAATNFVKNIGSPGAQAAQAIKKEVERYLLDNKERIPIQSRIVTRVFANFRGRVQSDGTKKAKHVLYSMPNIAKEFTESTPLFDYSDAGDGKERVDEKIKGKEGFSAVFQMVSTNLLCQKTSIYSSRIHPATQSSSPPPKTTVLRVYSNNMFAIRRQNRRLC